MALETATYISDLVSTNPTASDQKSQGDDHLRLIKTTVKATFPNITGAMTASHTELNYVVGVTSAIQTQINTKGAIAGQAWTGSHTFPTQSAADNSTKAATTAYVDAADALKANLASPALTGTPTAPTPSLSDGSTKIATTAYVDQTAFLTVLPNQSGNSGKFLTTNGAAASWSSIGGPAIMLFGDGSDGNVTINSGTTTLSRDMYYNNLTLSGTGTLKTNGWRVYVAGTLDISAAAAGAIQHNGPAASGTTAGGVTGTGTNVGLGAIGKPSFQTGNNGQNGGTSAGGGAGGVGGNVPGNAATAGASPLSPVIWHRVVQLLATTETGSTLIAGGSSGGGGSPSGDGNAQGAGSGSGGGIVQVFARYINRGGSTAAGAIQALGGNGGNGVNGAAGGHNGGSGGGGGGGGGWVVVMCESLLGTTASTAVDVTGGNGGNGGNGSNFSAINSGGAGGGSGGGGRFTLGQLATASFVDTLSSAATKAPTAVPANGVSSPGATGQSANTAQFSL